MFHKPLEHAATAPIAHSKVEQVACQDFGVPVDQDDRLEAAADNQQELQQHESKDDTRAVQQPQTGEDAAVGDGPVLAAHVSSSHGYDEGATRAIKVCVKALSVVYEQGVHAACLVVPACCLMHTCSSYRVPSAACFRLNAVALAASNQTGTWSLHC